MVLIQCFVRSFTKFGLIFFAFHLVANYTFFNLQRLCILRSVSQIPYFIFMTNKPCCPSKISLINVKIASQNTGVISTPKAGGMLPFASLNRGSEGHATIAHGNSFRFVSGYHDATTRQSCSWKSQKTQNIVVFIIIAKK